MASSQDTEITLGTGKMVAIFFGLVAVCAVFFSIGFKLGKDSVVSAPAAQVASTVAGGPRPSAAKSGSSSATPAAVSSAAQDAAPKDSGTPAAGDTAVAADAQAGGEYYVQVAAVSKQEDADALVESLKKKEYPAQSTSTGDKLFHVQVGPFNDIKDAEAVRTKLVSDGYNPILKK
jgi:cell division septation protein DedD